MKKLIIGLVLISILFSSSQVFAQVQNKEIGRPIVPSDSNTISKYCSSGTCITVPSAPAPDVNSNDSANIESKARYPVIMVIPSEICTRAIQNHVKTDCPPLENLTKYDNSNQNYSGKFVLQKDGTLTRSNPEVKNHWQYYAESKKTIVCVYCTGNYFTNDLYQTIIIEPDNFEYVPHQYIAGLNTNYMVNSTGDNIPYYTTSNELDAGLTSYVGRSVQACDTATISYSDELLADTISYLESGCTKTNYSKSHTQIVPNTPWIYNNPYSSLHYKSVIDNIKNVPPGDCIHYKCSQTTSSKKW